MGNHRAVKAWLDDRLGAVRVRQFFDRLRHRLSFVPGLYVVGSIVVVQATLFVDRNVDGTSYPEVLRTTVDSARSVFGALAGGLITSITLLLSMMLITIQLATVQFSPRTLRDWLGNRTLQHTVGLALGTTVYSLLALRSARTIGEGEQSIEITPHLSVLVALALGVLALFSVVRSVDHVTHSVRIGTVSKRIVAETLEAIESLDVIRAGQHPQSIPATTTGARDYAIPDSAAPIESPGSGWLQQIDENAVLDALPDGATGYLDAPLGAFVPTGYPLMWVDPAPPDDDPCREHLLAAFATGDSRTLQQDVGFGIVQLTDIAVRALSPGVNDPSTAADIIVQLGNVMLSLWANPDAPVERDEDGRQIVRRRTGHGEHLRRAYDPIRRYGAADPQVLRSLVREMITLRDEVLRRDLAGPLDPIDEMIVAVRDTADRTLWSEAESAEFDALVDEGARRVAGTT